MITYEQIPRVLGQPLRDHGGDRIGEIKQVYLSGATDKPEWLCVKTGRLIGRTTFVPIGTAEVVGDHVEIDFDKDVVKHAPDVDTDPAGLLPHDQEMRLYEHYGLSGPDLKDTASDIEPVRPEHDG